MSDQSNPRPDYEKPVCTACGSDDVRADAFAVWDTVAQSWELHSTYDNSVCESCGGECSLRWESTQLPTDTVASRQRLRAFLDWAREEIDNGRAQSDDPNDGSGEAIAEGLRLAQQLAHT